MKKNISTEDKKKPNQTPQPHETGKALLKRVEELLRKLKTSSSWSPIGSANSESGFFVGIDLGDKISRFCFLNMQGEIVLEDGFATTQKEFKAYFSSIPKARIAMEVGTHSPWTCELLESLGHIVFVANPRKMESIRKNQRKNDKVDARTLARLVRADPELLYPIRHRGVEARQYLVLLRTREALVGVRTALINSVRGLV